MVQGGQTEPTGGAVRDTPVMRMGESARRLLRGCWCRDQLLSKGQGLLIKVWLLTRA